MDENGGDPRTQFNFKTEHVEVTGGVFWGLGLAAVVEKSFFYYGLFRVRLVTGPLFLDVEFFKKGED